MKYKEFEKHYKEYYPKVLSYIKSKTSSKEDAEDITSTIFEKALRGLDSFTWQGLPFSAWLYKISRNTLIDYYRKGKDKNTFNNYQGLKVESPDNEHKIISNMYFEQILDTLNKRERRIVYMKFFEGHTNSTIAKKLKLTESNVGTIIYRVMKKLREKMTTP